MVDTDDLINIDIIITYQKWEQDFFNVYVSPTISEKKLITEILNLIDKDKLYYLWKISTCQTSKTGKKLNFLLDKNGKYFFNTDSDDPELTYWDNFLIQYRKKIDKTKSSINIIST